MITLNSEADKPSQLQARFTNTATRAAEDITSVRLQSPLGELTCSKAYDAPLYPLPNDEPEQDRLDLQHHAFRVSTNGPLYLAPIRKDIHNALDVGCGTGIVRLSSSVALANSRIAVGD
jgi:hypothetical protein